MATEDYMNDIPINVREKVWEPAQPETAPGQVVVCVCGHSAKQHVAWYAGDSAPMDCVDGCNCEHFQPTSSSAPQILSAQRSQSADLWEKYVNETWGSGAFDEGLEFSDWAEERFKELETALAAEREQTLELKKAAQALIDAEKPKNFGINTASCDRWNKLRALSRTEPEAQK